MSSWQCCGVRSWVVAVGLVSVLALFVPPLIPDSTGQNFKQESAFLKLGNIRGEAMANAFRDQIVLLNLSYDITQAGQFENPPRTSIAAFSELKLVKEVDKSSPSLAGACATKAQFPKAEISVLGGSATPGIAKITLERVIVSSVAIEYQAQWGRPVETITLKYQKAAWEVGTAKGGYDLRLNSKQ